MGLDRLGRVCLVFLVPALGGCGHQHPPDRLLHGERAATLARVPSSVVTSARLVRGTTLGRRFEACRPDAVDRDVFVVERIGVAGESLTFADRRGRILYACDGGTDPAGEHPPPWCSTSAGRLLEGHLLDPRLDLGCRDRSGRPLAYAWIEPFSGARWVGVDQGTYEEIYEVLGGLPVRIAGSRRIDLGASEASFEVTQYDRSGSALLEGTVEAAVAG
jgi:hypothetical protein